MENHDVIKTYFHGLEKGSYEDIIKLFAADAVVHSPLYGKIEARHFYKDLFSDTKSSKIELKNIFINVESPCSAAAHFIYQWVLKNGTPVQFECVDVFKFDQSGKVQSLTIIYDTFHTREGFAKIHDQLEL